MRIPKGQRRVAIPKGPSVGESTFELHCRLELGSNQPIREFVPFVDRKYRVDFAWPLNMLAVEIESSVHRIKNRFATDIPKYNRLNLEGWTLLRFSRQMVESAEAIDTVKEFLSR